MGGGLKRVSRMKSRQRDRQNDRYRNIKVKKIHKNKKTNSTNVKVGLKIKLQ